MPADVHRHLPPRQVDYLFPETAAISAQCRDLIQKILVADPNKRLSIADIFQHPWVQQVGPAACRHVGGRAAGAQRWAECACGDRVEPLPRPCCGHLGIEAWC